MNIQHLLAGNQIASLIAKVRSSALDTVYRETCLSLFEFSV